MKRTLSLTLVGLLAFGTASAGNFTEINVEKAAAIIDAAIEAHGGDALLDDLQTVVIENHTTNHSVGQSLGTEAPWDRSANNGIEVIDLENRVFYTKAWGEGGGFEFSNSTIINGEESYQINHRSGTVQQIAEPDYDATSGPFVRVTPALLMRTLNDRRNNAHFLGETTAEGVDYNVIGFSMTVGPAISLYFEKDTNLLRRSERVLPNFGLVEYRFDDYQTKNTIPFNQKFTLLLNGDVNLERDNKSLQANVAIDAYLAVPDGLVEVPAIGPDALARQEVADGVWLIGGNGTYAMFVDMDDYVFAAGGTAGIPERIELLREVVGDKPIRYGMMTHHHFDHVLGVPAYEEEGATVIAATAHERIVRDAANDAERLDVQLVDERMTLESDRRVVEIIDIGPTAHSQHLLVAYLPEEGILFEADHFALPRVGPIGPAVSSTRTFAKSLAQLGIDAKIILAAHSPRLGTPDDLQEALDAEIFEANL
ncbi:MAG: MBL fold metallo-hydrolase [Pseudomonadota bacterium]